MIDHDLTLLMNRSADQLACDWCPHLDPDFETLQLPGHLERLWHILFGDSPDRYNILYRATRYINLVRSLGFDYYLDSMDARRTDQVLDLDRQTLSALPLSVVTATGSGSGAQAPRFSGTPVDDPRRGRIEYRYRVFGTGTGWKILDLKTNETVYEEPSSFTSRIVTLGTSGMSCHFDGQALTTDDAWEIQTLALPSTSLTDLNADLEASADVSTLLYAGSDVEPGKSLYLGWSSPTSLPEKIGCMITAWILGAERWRLNV